MSLQMSEYRSRGGATLLAALRSEASAGILADLADLAAAGAVDQLEATAGRQLEEQRAKLPAARRAVSDADKQVTKAWQTKQTWLAGLAGPPNMGDPATVDTVNTYDGALGSAKLAVATATAEQMFVENRIADAEKDLQLLADVRDQLSGGAVLLAALKRAGLKIGR